ncbi:la-related protein 6a [Lampris incognitus]|uniref:la-related protein 6a n=1 Tax=Lampris incognitus TaxID=2546036 RepID=UPI0024B4C0E9|nr:la-related protein 6a [Lampris incognitus]
MHALVNAFLRCLSFLFPPSWLCVSFCFWVGSECEEMPWPNPRARFKHRKPLTCEEVRAAAAVAAAPSISSTAAPPDRVSLAAADDPSAPPGSLRSGIGGLWQAVRRVVTAQRRRWCSRRRGLCTSTRCPVACDPGEVNGFRGGGEGGAAATGKAKTASKNAFACSADEKMSVAAEFPDPRPAGAAADASATRGAEDEVITVDKHLQEMGTVTITVAIQAAEDEDPEEVSNNVDFIGGSCSDDEIGRHDKSSGAGTSGGELEEDESWQPPDQELVQKLVAQIEYYLSDENLEHDPFLLKHIRRNKLGFVSVKLLTSFKKVKHLTRDWRTTAYALKHSTFLELNDEGRKVRRRSTVPVFAIESLPTRMLLLSDLQRSPELAALKESTRNGVGGEGGSSQQELLMKLLLKEFGVYGAIALVRVLKPGKDLPADLKRLSGRYTQLGTEECAIVEFEEVESAVKANEALGSEDGGTCSLGLRVVLIGTKPSKKKIPKERPREEGGMRKSRSLNSRVRELQYHGEDSACSSSETESNPTSPRLACKSQSCNKLSPTTAGITFQNNHLSPSVSPRNSPWSSPRASPCPQRKSQKSPLASEGRLSPESARRWADYSSDSSLTPSGSPWVQRRRQVASQENSPVGSPMLGRKIQNADGLPPGVTRLPRGPDGTRGFRCIMAGERGKTAATQT